MFKYFENFSWLFPNLTGFQKKNFLEILSVFFQGHKISEEKFSLGNPKKEQEN